MPCRWGMYCVFEVSLMILSVSRQRVKIKPEKAFQSWPQKISTYPAFPSFSASPAVPNRFAVAQNPKPKPVMLTSWEKL